MRQIFTRCLVGMLLVNSVALILATTVMAAAENQSDAITWSTPVPFSVIYTGIHSVQWQDFFTAVYWFHYFFLAFATGAVVTHLTSAAPVRWWWSYVYFGVGAFVPFLLGGWLCIFALVIQWESFDGEYFAEGWPYMKAIGLWNLSCFVLFYLSKKLRRTDPERPIVGSEECI